MKKTIGLMAGLMFVASGAAFAQNTELEAGLDAARDGYYDYAANIIGNHADKGDKDAQFNMALMYHSGLGVARDERVAVEFYEKAAASGHEMATAYLAAGYTEGWFGLEKNAEKAKYWSEKLPKVEGAQDGLSASFEGDRKFGWGGN